MATPRLTKHILPGSLGHLSIDVRTGDRKEPRPAVIILHGFKGFKDWGMFPVLAERLARAGMTAVSFNVSGSGVDDRGDFSRPELFGRNTYSAELEDLGRIASAVREGVPLDFPPPSSLGLVGHSRGGGIAILEAARNPEIDALVTWAAIANVDRWSAEAKEAWRRRGFVNIQNTRTGQTFALHTDLLDDIDQHAGSVLGIPAAASRVTAPWLIVHGMNDESVDVADARALHVAAQPGVARLLTVPDTGHTFGATHPFADMPASLERALTETVGWFSRGLT